MNLARYSCDRCGTSAIIAHGDSVAQWHEVKRIDAAETETTRLYCESCYRAWRQLQQRHDIEYQQFMTTVETGDQS
ncbi:hypothetical protein LRP57_04460 [Schaalia sp. lx-260]|nr:hypothetical protein [Schaalia sp. lx-260]